MTRSQQAKADFYLDVIPTHPPKARAEECMLEMQPAEGITKKLLQWCKSLGVPGKSDLEDYLVITEGYLKHHAVGAKWKMAPQMFYGGGASPIFEDQHRVLLENERLKTQLISEKRALLIARQSEVRLQSENDKLIDGVCELTKVNKILQAVLIAGHQKRVCFHETHVGVVSDSVGEQIEVTYETQDGPLKQIYNRKQFIHQKLPSEGERIEAHVVVAIAPSDESKRSNKDQTSDLPEFKGKGISGTIRL